MEAACRGARSEGGHTIGIMPGRNAKETPPNSYVEFPIYTGMGYARNIMVVAERRGGDRDRRLVRHAERDRLRLINDIPVVGLDTWDFAYHGHESERIVRDRTIR